MTVKARGGRWLGRDIAKRNRLSLCMDKPPDLRWELFFRKRA